ncbi:hypothetical protein GOL96_25515 [Sinorhizobium medicae]|nr:hypothetical protein [Sinorhizobium medicae]MDX1237174.1 hypothetical protein [Sinorhizobium medicae]
MNRREFFSLSAGAAIMPSTITATEHIDGCQALTARLLASLKAKHGCDWIVHSDEMDEFILLRRAGD